MTFKIDNSSPSVKGLLELSDRALERAEACLARSQDVYVSAQERNGVTDFAQGALSGYSTTAFATGVMESARNIWSAREIESLGGYSTLQEALASANVEGSIPEANTVILCKHHNSTKMAKTAAQVEIKRSWIMLGLGVVLMGVGAAGNVVAPGASMILAGIGASMVFQAPFTDGSVTVGKSYGPPCPSNPQVPNRI